MEKQPFAQKIFVPLISGPSSMQDFRNLANALTTDGNVSNTDAVATAVSADNNNTNTNSTATNTTSDVVDVVDVLTEEEILKEEQDAIDEFESKETTARGLCFPMLLNT